MQPRANFRLSILAYLPLACLPLCHAATILEVNFNTWVDSNSDGNLDDGDRIQDVSGNGYHGFWGNTNSNIPVISTSNGQGIDTSGTANGKVFLRDGLTGIPDAWDGPTTTVTPYFTFNGTQSYTFEAVVNWNNTSQAINGLMGQVTGNELWIREKDGFLHYAFVSGAANASLFTNTIDISAAKADGDWHGLAVVYDATVGNIRTLGTMVNGTADFFVGAYNATTNNYFDGLQDTYRISSGALTASQFLPVPEPSSLIMVGLGLLPLLRRRVWR
jgi:hypothetical protein